MLTVPKDQAHFPLEGQVIELLPWSALLSNGQKNAELSGFLAKVDGSYNPDTQDLFITKHQVTTLVIQYAVWSTMDRS